MQRTSAAKAAPDSYDLTARLRRDAFTTKRVGEFFRKL
jgi:hypothetical protein